MNDFDYCEDLVRRFDEDRYLSAVFAPAARRTHLFALYALNFEIAKTAEAVSQAIAGKIRLQWWRDTIDGIYAGPVREHPAAVALATTVREHDLPRALFDELIDARESDLEPEPFADMDSLERYADATSGNVMRLGARILDAGETCDAAARDAGTAFALAGLLRAAPFHEARGRTMLPRNMSNAEALKTVTQRALELLRNMPRVPRRFLPALLPAALVPLYLRDGNKLERYCKQWAMIRAMITGRLRA